jgi:CDP-6-deoxy-D-xylo-4-hexulose-3-dehydrase
MLYKKWYAPNGMEAYGQEEIDAVAKCLQDGWLAGTGKYTTEFEQKVATHFGKKYGLFVNSGSSAIILALSALELPPGSEVITPACTFATTVAPILQCGHVPKFVDVELTTYVPSVDSILSTISPTTRVILLPNLIGNCPDWKALREGISELGRPDIILIEDSADTIVHTEWSDISTTSFYSSHVITACGSGGMVMFNSEDLLKRATMYRDWGRVGNNTENVEERFAHTIEGTDIKYDFKFLYSVVGYNMKSSEVNAAFGLVQLEKLPNFLEVRRRNVNKYMELLKDLAEYGLVLPSDSLNTNWLAFPLQHPERMELLTFLEANNIQTRVTFSGNITRHPAFKQFKDDYANADVIMANGFLLGCHHGMTTEDVEYICSKIREFVTSYKSNV